MFNFARLISNTKKHSLAAQNKTFTKTWVKTSLGDPYTSAFSFKLCIYNFLWQPPILKVEKNPKRLGQLQHPTPHTHLSSRRPFYQEALQLRDASYDVNNM